MLCYCPKQFELWGWKHGFVFGCDFNLCVKGKYVESDDFYVLDFEIAVLRLNIFKMAVYILRFSSWQFLSLRFAAWSLEVGLMALWLKMIEDFVG